MGHFTSDELERMGRGDIVPFILKIEEICSRLTTLESTFSENERKRDERDARLEAKIDAQTTALNQARGGMYMLMAIGGAIAAVAYGTIGSVFKVGLK